MMFTNFGLLTVAFTGLASATVRYPVNSTVKPEEVIPGAYIVTFESALPSANSFYQNLTANGITVVPRRTFAFNDAALLAEFSGVSFNLTNGNITHLDVIGNFSQVKSITPVRLHKLASPFQVRDFTATADQLKERAAAVNITMSTHQMTGVDRLYKEGLDGSGIKIGIIDTGVDYTLAALGGGYGAGKKIAKGYDLVGNYDANGQPAPDSDPMDCLGHGTHVAGIIGASNDPYIRGVAPNASLYVYKVFACYDGVGTDVLIAAFIMARNDGVDLITASIGGGNPWPHDPWAAATAAIVKAGTPCMLAAGNAGEVGLFFTSTAASGTDVTAVGSVDNINTPIIGIQASAIVAGSPSVVIEYAEGIRGWEGVSLPVVANSLDITVKSDACTKITKTLSAKAIILIRRGDCFFDDQVTNAVAAGAKYILFYNNEPGIVVPYVYNEDIVAAGLVSAVTGEAWVAALKAGKAVTVSFSKSGIFTPGPPNSATGGAMSSFSSYGLDAENNIKPVVSAPGGNILSTFPYNGGYEVLSGTSMATPFVAGVVALYMQAKGKASLKPKDINTALSTSASPIKYNNGSPQNYLSSVAQQGGGLVNAWQMVHTNISVDEGSFSLNDTAHITKDPSFYIKNTGTTSVTYKLTHEPAANVYAFDSSYGSYPFSYGDSSYAVAYTPPIDTKSSSAVTFTPSSITIAAGSDARVKFTVPPSSALNATLVPVYSGFLKITSSVGGDYARIPYAGVAARMNDIQTADPVGFGRSGDNESTGKWPFEGGTIPIFRASYMLPSWIWSNAWASKNVRIDVVSLDRPNPVYALGLQTIGSLPGWPATYIPRNPQDSYHYTVFWGDLSDGTVVPSGAYKLVLRVCKPFGNPTRVQDYESYDSFKFYLDMVSPPPE